MSILAMILAGGKGERLHPLTIHRAKPAVPFGGIYRIIDFTLSNCINSGIRKIAVLPQYKSLSLDKHLRLAWNFFSGELNEYIISVPPQQRVGDKWYQGTADAIYQNIYMIEKDAPDHLMVLAGDHIYKMDYAEMLRFHEDKGADATVAAIEMPRNGHRRSASSRWTTTAGSSGSRKSPVTRSPYPAVRTWHLRPWAYTSSIPKRRSTISSSTRSGIRPMISERTSSPR